MTSDGFPTRRSNGETRLASTAELDRAFDALGDPARRAILLSLLDGPTTIELDGGNRVELRHNHLPRLTDAGYVEWDSGEKQLSRGPAFEEIEPLLRTTAAIAEGATSE